MPLEPGARFFLNDPEYAPFGRQVLRGVTPARLATLVVALSIVVCSFSVPPLLRGDYWGAFTVFLEALGRNFVSAVPGFLLLINVERRTAEWPARRRALRVALSVFGAAALYTSICWGVRYLHNTIGDPAQYWQLAVAHTSRGLVLAGLLGAILFHVEGERRAARRLQREQLASIAIEKQIAEARLQVLQAQIEPHFVFNTLASVKRLYESDPAAARRLLGHLLDYFGLARARSVNRDTSLAEEVRLARSFLAIFEVRMAGRLKVDIDVPPDVAAARVPPLMLGTLVENAIKHGLGPRALGGTVRVSARRHGDTLELEVHDDGAGFQARSGPGIGLANTRARLETLFGDAAALEVGRNPMGGVDATIRLPYRDTSEEALA